jgi:hypothetical protein
MAPNRESTQAETAKTCCCCGEEFQESVESYAIICERCVNVWDGNSQTA